MRIFKTFSNLDGLRTYLNSAKENAVFAGLPLSSRNPGDDFSGTATYEEADALLRDGDAKTAARLKAATAANVKTLGEGTRTKRFHAVCGGAVCVPATIMGLPKSMIRTERVKFKDSKVISICYNGTTSANVGQSEMREVSARLMGAIVGLEKNGYRVNLYVFLGSSRGRDACGMFVRIKDSGQYIDIKKTAYPLVNPSMLRRHYFRYLETAPGLTNTGFYTGYGAPITDRAEIESAAKDAGLHLKKIVSFYDIRRISESSEIVRMLSD